MKSKMKEAIQTNRSCLVCNSGFAVTLGNYSTAVLQNLPLTGDFSIVSCSNCGFVYNDSISKHDDYDKYYKTFNKYEVEVENKTKKEIMFQSFMNEIKKHFPEGGVLADIGCGNGLFLQYLDKNLTSRLIGIDPSVDTIKMLRSKGLTAHEGFIYGNLPYIKKESLDFITLISVVEHLFNPRKAIKNIVEYLKPDGKLGILVPNVAKYSQYDNSFSYYFNLEHINHFSSESLNNLMGTLSFKNLSYSEYVFTSGSSKVPTFFSIYEQSAEKGEITFDTKAKTSVLEYLKKIHDKKLKQERTIDDLKKSGEEVVIWGTGAVFMELLANTNIQQCNITGFIDNNKVRQGNYILNQKVSSKDVLYGTTATILVCASVYALDIIDEIRSMGIKNKTIVLN